MKDTSKKTGYSLQNNFSVSLFLLVASALLLTLSTPAISQDISPELKVEHQVISIQQQSGPVPATVIVKRGTTVIWLNYSNEPNVIKFQSQKVTTACRAPVNFVLAEDGSYQSIPLQIGAAASLCFVEKGTFEYVIRKPAWYGDSGPQTVVTGTVKVY
jgi:plastocyanin